MVYRKLHQSTSIYPTKDQTTEQTDRYPKSIRSCVSKLSREAPTDSAMKESFIHYEFVAEQSNKAEARTLIRKHVMLGVQRRKRWQRGVRFEESSVTAVRAVAGPLTEVTTNTQSCRTLSSAKDSKSMVLRQGVASFAKSLNTLQLSGISTGSQKSTTVVDRYPQNRDAARRPWVPSSFVSLVGSARADPFGMFTWGDLDPYLGECADFCKHNMLVELLAIFWGQPLQSRGCNNVNLYIFPAGTYTLPAIIMIVCNVSALGRRTAQVLDF